LISLGNFNAQIAFKSGKSTHHDPGISGKQAGNELSGQRAGSAQSSSTVLSAAALISSSRATNASFASIAKEISSSEGRNAGKVRKDRPFFRFAMWREMGYE
jgi:hypothetical protein